MRFRSTAVAEPAGLRNTISGRIRHPGYVLISLYHHLQGFRAQSVDFEASRVPVPLPIAFHGFRHIPGGRAQPI